MDISLNDEQEAVVEAVKDILAEAWPREAMRKYADEAPVGDDSALWETLRQAEFHTVFAPDSEGGGGSSLFDALLFVEAFGYALAPSRFATSAVAATFAASQCRASAARTLALSGEHALALVDSDDLSIDLTDDGAVLSGTAKFVPDVSGAGRLIVVSDEFVGLLDPAALGPAIEVTPVDTVDTTRQFSNVTFNSAAVSGEARLEPVDGSRAFLEQIRAVRVLTTVFDSLGGAHRALDMAVEYSQERFQFGRAIGSFQSLQHLMADAYVAIENLRSAAWYAASAVETSAADRDFAVLAAGVIASKAYLQASDLNIQVHGGMGFTVEVDAYLYAGRAKVNEVVDGTLASRVAEIAHWLQTADLPELVEYLGGQRLQLGASMFGES